jgi:hypothetical protein
MSDEKEAIFRNAPETGGARKAYDDLVNWALDDMQPQLQRAIKAKLDELAREHGVPRKKIAIMLYRPPAGEPHKELVNFLYDTLFE